MAHSNRTSVNQSPLAGTIYPFVKDISDASRAIVDIRINFDPITHIMPLKLTLMGDIAGPRPTIVITDYVGVLMFDTRLMLDPQISTWGDKYSIYKWSDASGVLAVVTDNEAAALIDQSETEFDLDMDLRTSVPNYPGVRTIQVFDIDDKLLVQVQKPDLLRLNNGYNTTWTFTPPVTNSSSGNRLSYDLTLAAIPGSGLGTFDNCEDVSAYIRTINKFNSTSTGNMAITGTECFRIEPFVSLHGDYATIRDGIVIISDDCEACCDCNDFQDVYRAMLRSQRKYQETGAKLSDMAATYGDVKDFIESRMSCAKASLLKVQAAPGGNCQTTIAAGICNPSGDKIDNASVTIEISQITQDGTAIPVNSTAGASHAWIMRNGKPTDVGALTRYGYGYKLDLGCIEPNETKVGVMNFKAFVGAKAQVCVGIGDWSTTSSTLVKPTQKVCTQVSAVCEDVTDTTENFVIDGAFDALIDGDGSMFS